MARPLREQLRERVNAHHERKARTVNQAVATGHNRHYREEMLKNVEETTDAAAPVGYAPGDPTPLPPGALMPRVGELEDARREHEHRFLLADERVSGIDLAHNETEQQLATAIARLAKLVGVNPADLGL